jgi:hypothetical protein
MSTLCVRRTDSKSNAKLPVDNCVGEKELAVTVEFIEKRFAQSVVSFQTKAHKTQRSRKDDFKTIV